MARAVLEALPVGVLIEDPDASTWMNAELRRIWRRHDADSPEPGSFERSLVPALRGSRRAGWPVPDMFGHERSWKTYQLRRGDGTIGPVLITTRRLAVGWSAALEATFVVEAARPESEASVRRTFLAMIDHELRTPITSIVGGAELLRGNLDGPTREEVTDLLVEEANRVHRLVGQLTSLSGLRSAESLGLEPVHLIHLVRAVGSREAARRRGVRIKLPSLDPPLPAALGDEGSIAQVLAIFIDNAAKHGAPSAAIDIEVEDAGREVVVHVLDRGPGLPDLDQERLFDLFERAGATQAGTGIGLYVARQLVLTMGGTVRAAPRMGGGADFSFSLVAATGS
jgi:signal transduction histidine kinase